MPSTAPFVSSLPPDFANRRKNRPQAAPIVVHSHLSWDNVWQRPQQYFTRLARWHSVLFIETEVREEGTYPFYEHGLAAGSADITQLKVIFPRASWGDGAYVDRERRRLVKTALLEPSLRKFARPIQWFYDPMAAPAFLGHLEEILVVYDCMDELSQFRGAPPELLEREAQLLEAADVVFCGGKKLHESKSVLHPDCHYYGCGVDVTHFAAARNASTKIPVDIRSLPKPIFGYYGVIDERLDYRLLLSLAQRTKGSVVLIGPTAKLQVGELPQHPKLHWLGRRPYEELPAYAKGFDVCLMPFAMNEATEFINPTKALEYLAAGRPVVSTPVPDVVSQFADVVHIAKKAGDFIDLCHAQVESPSKDLQKAGIRRATNSTWERFAAEMEGHLNRKLRQTNAASVRAAYSLMPQVGSV